MIRAVFFDLDGTLVDRDAAAMRWWDDLVRKRRLPVGEKARKRFEEIDDHGYRDRLEFAQALVEAFPALGMTAPELMESFLRGIASFVEPDEEVDAVVGTLARRYRVAVITNGNVRTQTAKLASAGLADLLPAFVSEMVGYEKPDPRIFRTAAASFGLDPRDVVYVGDHPERDIIGAASCDMLTCWVSRGREWTDARLKPDMTIERIHDALKVFGS